MINHRILSLNQLLLSHYPSAPFNPLFFHLFIEFFFFNILESLLFLRFTSLTCHCLIFWIFFLVEVVFPSRRGARLANFYVADRVLCRSKLDAKLKRQSCVSSVKFGYAAAESQGDRSTTLSKRMSKKMPKKMSKRMSKKTSNRMSKKMSKL